MRHTICGLILALCVVILGVAAIDDSSSNKQTTVEGQDKVEESALTENNETSEEKSTTPTGAAVPAYDQPDLTSSGDLSPSSKTGDPIVNREDDGVSVELRKETKVVEADLSNGKGAEGTISARGAPAPRQAGDGAVTSDLATGNDKKQRNIAAGSASKLQKREPLGKTELHKDRLSMNHKELRKHLESGDASIGIAKITKPLKSDTSVQNAEEAKRPSTNFPMLVNTRDYTITSNGGTATPLAKDPPRGTLDDALPISRDVPLLVNNRDSTTPSKDVLPTTEFTESATRMAGASITTERKVDAQPIPEPAKSVSPPADNKVTSTVPPKTLPSVSTPLPLHNSVDKTDGSLGSSSLFALAALATLAVAAAAPAH